MLYVTLRQMEYVVTVARERSLSGAAAQLNVSQPSLSNALNQVEARLGHRLFRRRKGGPTIPTPEGEAYVREAEQLLMLAQRLEDPRRYAQSVSGRLTLGLFDDLAPFHLGPLLDRLARDLPDLDLQYRIGDFETLARDLQDGRIDIALTYDLGFDASFHRETLASVTPHALVATDDRLAERDACQLLDLADRPLILFQEGLSVRHMLGLFRQIGKRPRVAHRVRSLEVMRSLAARGAGIGISYNTPRTTKTYDGRQVRAIGITDPSAAEPLVLVQAADTGGGDRLDAARAVIRAHVPR